MEQPYKRRPTALARRNIPGSGIADDELFVPARASADEARAAPEHHLIRADSPDPPLEALGGVSARRGFFVPC